MLARALIALLTVLVTALRWLICGMALMLGLIGPASNAQAPASEKRIALVIGNADYQTKRLGNPENDARLISDNLRKLGFEVTERSNLGMLEFRRALRDFARRVQQDDAVAVFYYAGHGMQIDGRNYLLPVDLNLRDQEEVKDESVDIDDLFLSRIDKVGSHARIVILDACRDNPFGKKKTRNISTSSGLAEMGARGTLIAFASAPGAPAEDGPDGGNSIYTKSLAEEMMAQGVEIEQMFKNVRVRVLRDTAGRQLPWVNTSLTSNFSFNPGEAASVQATQGQPGRRRQEEMAAAAAPLQPTQPSIVQPPALPPPAASAPATATAAFAESAPAIAPAGAMPPPAATTLTTSPGPPSGPKVASAAPQSATANAVASGADARKFLNRDELQQLLVGKTHILRGGSASSLMRWDVRSGGMIYYNSQTPSNIAVNGSGRWELKDDGSFCAKFGSPISIMARAPDDGCWYYFRQGGRLARVSVTTPLAQPQFEVMDVK